MCSPKGSPQEASVAYVAAEVSRLLRDPEYVGAVFVIQTYVVGKENILLAVGRRDGEYSSTYGGLSERVWSMGYTCQCCYPHSCFGSLCFMGQIRSFSASKVHLTCIAASQLALAQEWLFNNGRKST